MNANAETLEKISSIIRAEFPKHLSQEFVIHDVTAQNRPGPDDEDYVHVRVVLEDDHPRLDPRKLMQFENDVQTLLERASIGHTPNISYANRSEISL